MKHCRDCGLTLPLDAFYRHRGTKDGRDSYCKTCARSRRKAWYVANAERASATSRAYYESHREAIKARSRRDYYGNREARLEAHRAYHREHWPEFYARNAEKYRVKAQAYYRAHRHRWPQYNARRRSAMTEATPEVRAWVAYLLEQSCVYCGNSEPIEVDHVVPLSRGGTHSVENLAPACRPCNRAKGAKLLSEWDGGPQ